MLIFKIILQEIPVFKFEIFKNIKKIHLLFIILIIMASGCVRFMGYDFKEENNWKLEKTDSFYLYYRENSNAEKDIEVISENLKKGKIKIENFLNIRYNEVIHVYLFESKEDINMDSLGGYAYPLLNSVSVIYQDENYNSIGEECMHEITHVIAGNTLTDITSPILSEGLACAIDYKWSMDTVDYYTKEYIKRGTYVSISILSGEEFRNIEENISYPISGSFVLYLVNVYGIDKFKKVYIESNMKNLNSVLEKYYEKGTNEIEKEFLEYIKNKGSDFDVCNEI